MNVVKSHREKKRMSDVFLGICAGVLILLFISPYLSLWNLRGIADNLDRIDTELHEISKQLKRINETERFRK